MLEHLLRFSWFGTLSVVSYVLLHHDILFACYNIDDDDEDDEEKEEKDEDEDEDENEDENENEDEDEDCCSSRRPW